MAQSRASTIARWTGFVISIFATALSFWNFSFNAVVILLKDTFNYTQSEVEMVSSMGWASAAVCCVGQVITAWFGYQVSYAVGFVMTSAAAGLYYQGASNAEEFHHWPALIGLYQLTATAGLSFMMYQIINIGINNFSEKHTGKIVGLYTASGATGKFFYAGLIELFFQKDLKGLFVTLLIIWSVVFLSCALLHREQAIDDNVPNAKETLEVERESPVVLSETWLIKDMLKCPQFHLLFWPAVFLQAAMLSFMDNITSIGQSMGVETPASLVYELALAIVLSRLLFGIAFDKIKPVVGKFVLLCLGTSAFAIGTGLCTLLTDSIGVYVATALAGLGMASGYSLPLSLLILKFGGNNYTFITIMLHLFYWVFVSVFQIFIGLLYDHQAQERNFHTVCYGSNCFFVTFMTLCSVALAVLLLQILNWYVWIKRQ